MSSFPVLLETRIHLDGVPVRLTASDWGDLPGGGFVYHVEFRSVDDPPRPIPVSKTGYLSQFAVTDRTLDGEELRACALELAAAQREATQDDADGQPSLFG